MTVRAAVWFWLRQEMDEGSIRQRKESQNGSTGHGLDERGKDESAVKATVLQKEVSVTDCVPENNSRNKFTLPYPTTYLFFP